MDQTALPCLDIGMPDKARAERLRLAVKSAGGNLAVAARAHVPVGTLNNYLAGRDPKVGAFVALAAACSVSLEWLATGQGRMLTEGHMKMLSTQMHEPSADGSHLVETDDYRKLQADSAGLRDQQQSLPPQPTPVNRAYLAQAIEIVKKLDGIGAFESPAVADRIADAYDILTGAKP